MACLVPPFHEAAASPWAAPPLEALPQAGSVAADARAVASFSPGLVPPFRSAPRDRSTFGVAASAWFGSRVRAQAEWNWLVDDTAAGAPVSGPGDVRLGTAVRVASTGPLRLGVGWEAKLPNAKNEDELGSDETDITLGVWARVDKGPVQAGLAMGLAVLGNPLRYANQDDVPMVLADVGARFGAWGFSAFGTAELPTALNPARVEAGGCVRAGERWFVEAEGAAGFTPAAADGRILLRLGVAGSLPDTGRGE